MICKTRIAILVSVLALGAGAAGCAAAIKPVDHPDGPSLSAFWEEPRDLAARDLFRGPWGAKYAPRPDDEYTFLRPKTGGFSPGVVVSDPQGRTWHVKQPTAHDGDEGPVEVVLSRVLTALGYHQPPVFYLPSFSMREDADVRREQGGRFRLDLPSLKARGEWSWQQNPFVGQRPYQGLLVILMLFNSSDLKNSNNTLYEYDAGDGRPPHLWFVVRDIGLSLGRTGRFSPPRNDFEAFSDTRFITGVRGDFVQFDFHGLHQELVRDRITRLDVAWAMSLVSRLSERQWQDAFRAGGYPPDLAARYIGVLRARIAEGIRIGAGADATH